MSDFDQELPVIPQVALADVKWYAEHPPSADDEGVQEVLRAAQALAIVIERALALQASRIGADDYIKQFDPRDLDSYSFYQGASFALARVRQTLGAWEGPLA